MLNIDKIKPPMKAINGKQGVDTASLGTKIVMGLENYCESERVLGPRSETGITTSEDDTIILDFSTREGACEATRTLRRHGVISADFGKVIGLCGYSPMVKSEEANKWNPEVDLPKLVADFKGEARKNMKLGGCFETETFLKFLQTDGLLPEQLDDLKTNVRKIASAGGFPRIRISEKAKVILPDYLRGEDPIDPNHQTTQNLDMMVDFNWDRMLSPLPPGILICSSQNKSRYEGQGGEREYTNVDAGQRTAPEVGAGVFAVNRSITDGYFERGAGRYPIEADKDECRQRVGNPSSNDAVHLFVGVDGKLQVYMMRQGPYGPDGVAAILNKSREEINTELMKPCNYHQPDWSIEDLEFLRKIYQDAPVETKVGRQHTHLETSFLMRQRELGTPYEFKEVGLKVLRSRRPSL